MTESQTLYRKYRPVRLEDVRGQEHIVGVLGEALKDGTTAHAYLFAGTRGIGKTSIARIIASELGTSDNDIHEIDAASNRGIDDIRELREAVHAMPFDSEKKVYIIDEVHMLTKEAFNALLKTLEEPPTHVVFILATTELHKVPDTIISRCEVHHFHKPSQSVLREHLQDLGKKEKVTIEDGAADLIALLADGSFRDALGVLQKVLSSVSGTTITTDNVAEITGAPTEELVNTAVNAFAQKDISVALGVVHDAVARNMSVPLLTEMMLERVRQIMLVRHATDMREAIMEEVSEDTEKLVDELAGTVGKSINSVVLKRLLEAHAAMRFARQPHIVLELALIELLGEGESGTLFE